MNSDHFTSSPTPSQSWIVDNLRSLISNHDEDASDCTLTSVKEDNKYEANLKQKHSASNLNNDNYLDSLCDSEVETETSRKHCGYDISYDRIPKRSFSPEEIQPYSMHMPNDFFNFKLNDESSLNESKFIDLNSQFSLSFLQTCDLITNLNTSYLDSSFKKKRLSDNFEQMTKFMPSAFLPVLPALPIGKANEFDDLKDATFDPDLNNNDFAMSMKENSFPNNFHNSKNHSPNQSYYQASNHSNQFKQNSINSKFPNNCKLNSNKSDEYHMKFKGKFYTFY